MKWRHLGSGGKSMRAWGQNIIANKKYLHNRSELKQLILIKTKNAN